MGLDGLITNTVMSPPKMIVYGQPGIGKTTFAASADAVLVDCENGAGTIPNLRRTPFLETWPQMREWLMRILNASLEDAPVVAVDTIDWMITRIVEYVTIDLDGKKPQDITNTIGSAHGGYYKARDIVSNIVHRDVLPALNAIAARGSAVILLAHAQNTKITSPEGYDVRMAAPDLPEWILPIFIEWSDAILYASPTPEGKRIATTTGTNVIVAKNRYSLPPQIDLSWPAFVSHLNGKE